MQRRRTCARLARNVDWTMAARIDEGLARYSARTKCIFLPSAALPEFCPNAKFFGCCAAADAHDQFFAPQADA
jgi:hypothetical protein